MSDEKSRINRVITRTGDGGDTSLADGSRVRKSHARIQALGSLDELNSQLGVLISALPQDDELTGELSSLQHRIFDLGGAVATPGAELLVSAWVTRLDESTQRINAVLPPLKEFVLPGGSPAAAAAHVARTVCRRAERDLLALIDAAPAAADVRWLPFMNRLSDYLFVVARMLARRTGGEVVWQPYSAD